MPIRAIRVIRGETCAKIDITSGSPRMPNGYYLPYVSDTDQPYWHFEFGKLPKRSNIAGTIPKGSVVYLQRPPDTLGTHQSAYLYGVGRILVSMGKFRPAPAMTTDS